jgi:hypothetical protein
MSGRLKFIMLIAGAAIAAYRLSLMPSTWAAGTAQADLTRQTVTFTNAGLKLSGALYRAKGRSRR